MITIFIYDSCGDDSLKFFVMNGDYSHLHEVYINSTDDEQKLDQLNEILDSQPKMLSKFPRKTLLKYPDAKIVHVGFCP